MTRNGDRSADVAPAILPADGVAWLQPGAGGGMQHRSRRGCGERRARWGAVLGWWLTWSMLGPACWAASEPDGGEALPKPPTVGAASRADLPEALQQLAPGSVEQLRAMEGHVRGLVGRVSPAVVAVRVGMAVGSGVVVSPDGWVLSAAHVAGEPGRDARFTFPDGRVVRGRTLGTDHGMDAGLLRITEEGPWPHVDLAESESGTVGDWVLALGHPGGFDPERPALVRLGRIIRRTGSMVQTDCTIVSGDSGGPLFDMHGRVVGIHSRISESTAANFHAPVGSYLASWERLARGETWGRREPRSRAWVGLRGVDHPGGFRLEQVVEDGPAFKAGLRVGDLVTQLDGQPVKDYATFLQALSRARPGDKVRLEALRAEERWEVEVQVEPRRRGRRPFGGG